MRDRVVAAVGDVYDIDAEIGRGGMAIVYRATDVRLKRRVAVKVLPPELAFRDDVRRRFLREAETAAQLSHPHIVPIYTVDERAGLVFFVMALVDGESLAQRAARERIPIPEARRILAEVADALDYAHGHGVVHRDVKPDNILLERESGYAMVTDFGIARAAEADSRLTVTGIAVGTPAYMSPEQALGERDVDGRSDIYSLGVVAYQILAGELPFKANNTPAMMMKHISEAPRPLRELRPDVPAALDAAIGRALAKRAEDRWPNAAAFRDALRSTAIADPSAPPWQHAAVPLSVRRSPSPPVAAPAYQPASRPAPPGPAGPPVFAPAGQWAGNIPWQAPWGPAGPLAAGAMPPITRREWRRYARAQYRAGLTSWSQRPLEQRVMSFRRELVSSGFIIGSVAVINFLTSPGFPWFVFPALGIGMNVVRQWSRLWAEGVTWKQIFHGAPLPTAGAASAGPMPAGAPPGALAPSTAALDAEAARLAPAEVLAGPHGAAVRRAAGDRMAILGIVNSLGKADRELIPDVAPTVTALAERAGSLAQTLHHLDADGGGAPLADLESRIAAVKAEPAEAADRERRLSLLERQHTSRRELADRRARLFGQLESVQIALQNLKLDLLKLRSAGVQSALSEVTSATVEARALSREIGHVVDAADEVRRM